MAVALALGANLGNSRSWSYTGSISGTTLTVSGVSGTIAIGQAVYAPNGSVAPGTVIVSGSGTSWTVNVSQTVASTAMSSAGTVYTLAKGTYRPAPGNGSGYSTIYQTGTDLPGDVYVGQYDNSTIISGAMLVPSGNWSVLTTNLYTATAGTVDTGSVSIPVPLSANTKITGYISGTTLTISTTVTNAVQQGQTLWDGTGLIAAGTTVVSGSGTTWTVSISQTVGSSGSPATIYGTAGFGTLSTSNLNANFSEDLWLNGTKLTRVLGQSAATTANTWWFNPSNNSINVYRTSTPSGADTYEYTGVYIWCYAGGCSPTKLQNITFDKFAGSAYTAVIHQCQNWTIENCTFQNNTGPAFNLSGGGAVIRNCKITNNGSFGFYASGGAPQFKRTYILNTEVSYCNMNLFDLNWGCGGYKAFQYGNVTIAGCNFHDNYGPGIWHDTDCYDVLILGNKVTNCYAVAGIGAAGIFHEISNGITKISNNYVSGATGAGIWIFNSRNVEVCGNRVTVGTGNTTLLGGIIAYNWNRGNDGNSVAYQTVNLNVHHNIIAHPSDTSVDGINITSALTAPNIVWNYNTYLTSNTTGTFWRFDPLNASGSSNVTWAQVQSGGLYEQNGANAVSSTPVFPTALSALADGRGVGAITPGNIRDAMLDILINESLFPIPL